MTRLGRASALLGRITAFAGSMYVSGVAPFLSPVMFIYNESSCPAMVQPHC